MSANRYGALRKALWAMFALTTAALVGAAVWVIRLDIEVLNRRIEREALNLRTLLVDQMGRSFSALDVFLEDTAPAVSSGNAQAGALGAAMRRTPSSHLRALLVLDAQGNVISSAGTFGASPPHRIPDDWTAQRAESPAGTHVSTPIEWPGTGELRVLVSRPLDPGRIGRYLAAVVDVGFFGEMFTPLDIGANSGWFVAIIRGRQVSQLARYPDYPGAVGREIELSEARLRAIAGGVMPLPMPAQFTADGVARLLYYGRLRDQPLYAGIGLSRKAIRDEVLLAGLRNGALATLALLAVTLLFWSLLRQIRLVEAKDADEAGAVRRLSESEERFQRIFRNSPYPIVIVRRADLKIVEGNDASLALLGFSREEAFGKTGQELNIWENAEDRARVLERLAAQNVLRDVEVRLRAKSGVLRDVLMSAEMIELDGEGLIVSTLVDITERKRAEERIRHLATRDALTELPNRLLLVDRLSQAIAACKREGTQLAVLFLGLDRFKLVNDSLGHEVGDRLLREVADRIGGSMRQEDTLARLGGDEFVLVAYGLRSPDAAVGVAGKILAAVAPPFVIDGNSINVATSIGISIYPGDAPDAQGLLRSADIAMYQAKEHGGGRYEYYSEDMNARVIERQQIEGKLSAALAEEALYLVYQPKVDIRSGRVTGAEALLRWEDAELGPVSPLKFIGVAEETGLIIPLGRWVMVKAFRQLAVWIERGWSFPIAINLSVRQFTEGLVDEVERALREASVDPRWIELEITENIFLHEVEENVNIVGRLSRLGAAVTLDDFGTGYSSFSYLKRFAVSGIKIDQSFVRDVTHSQDASIVGAIVAMAHNLGMKAVAEGVETGEQLKVLKELGCDEYQGYLFSRPLPVPEFEALLEIPRGGSGRRRTLRS